MAERNDRELDKFQEDLLGPYVKTEIVTGTITLPNPATMSLADLELKKFTSDGKVRVIVV